MGATPGPWVVSVKKRNRICGPEGVIVAETWRPPARAKKGYNFAAWATAHENAGLIAAAPDMLEALNLMDAFLYAMAPESNERQIVQRAIARASTHNGDGE